MAQKKEDVKALKAVVDKYLSEEAVRDILETANRAGIDSLEHYVSLIGSYEKLVAVLIRERDVLGDTARELREKLRDALKENEELRRHLSGGGA
jgi:hypothetical protein